MKSGYKADRSISHNIFFNSWQNLWAIWSFMINGNVFHDDMAAK